MRPLAGTVRVVLLSAVLEPSPGSDRRAAETAEHTGQRSGRVEWGEDGRILLNHPCQGGAGWVAG